MSDKASSFTGLRLALAAIIAHAVVLSFHSAAHQILGVEASPAQLIYIVVVIMAAPIVACILLWKRLMIIGAWLLVCSLAGAFVFGIFHHFVAISPDHISRVAELPQHNWVILFQVTAALLAGVEAFGIWAGRRILSKVEAEDES
jgi:hypothetical protein